MSEYDVEAALHRLKELGVDTSNLNQNYYQIPLENVDLSKVEADPPKKSKVLTRKKFLLV